MPNSYPIDCDTECRYFPGFSHLLTVRTGPVLANEFTKEDDIRAQELCKAASGVYDSEASRTKCLIHAWNKIFPGQSARGVEFNGTRVDMIIQAQMPDFMHIPVVLIEVKNEMGSTGSEPLMECISEYAHIFANVSAARVRNAPCLLIQLIGPYLHISGVVSSRDSVFVDPLCSPVLLLSTPFDQEASVRCIRHLKALKAVVQALTTFYATASSVQPSAIIPLFPLIPEVNLLASVEGKANVFRGVWHGRKVIVKIAQQYCEEAHKLCADNGFAPQLLHVHRMGVRNDVAVIMEDCEPAKIALYVTTDIRRHIRPQCKAVLSLLHSNGWVHGDFRLGNILVQQTQEGPRALLIDFDFAGRAGETTYPLNLNEAINWPEGVHASALLQTEHDLAFCRLLFFKVVIYDHMNKYNACRCASCMCYLFLCTFCLGYTCHESRYMHMIWSR